MTRSVLLTGGRIPSALELARALAQAGVRVFMADSYPIFLGQASRAVVRSFVVPSPRADLEAYQKSILGIVKEQRIDCVLPCSEEVLYLAGFREAFPPGCELFAAPPELLLALHHKQHFVELAQSWGLTVPRSAPYRGESGAALPDFTREPYILKRVYSRAGAAVHWLKAKEAPSSHRVPPDGSWLIQQGLRGRALCSFSVIQAGEVLLTSIYSPGSALGTVGVSFEGIREPRIEAWIEGFARASQYQGFVSFDFIASEGEVQAIECNPRLTSGIHLCDPAQLAAAVLERRRSFPPLRPRKRAQFFLALLAALPRALGKSAFWPQLPRLLRSPDVVASWRDPAPFLYQWICILYFVKQMIQRKKPLAACSMDGIEWDEDRPWPELLSQKKSS